MKTLTSKLVDQNTHQRFYELNHCISQGMYGDLPYETNLICVSNSVIKNHNECLVFIAEKYDLEYDIKSLQEIEGDMLSIPMIEHRIEYDYNVSTIENDYIYIKRLAEHNNFIYNN